MVKRRDAHELRLNVEDHRFTRSLQVYVEHICAARLPGRDQCVAPSFVLDPAEDRVCRIGYGLVGKVQPRVEPKIDAACHDPEADMRRLHAAITKGHRSWFDGREPK